MATTWLRTSMTLTLSGARGMATLKDIETRLKSVKNIKKITSSMKMVSAAKFTRAEKALKVSSLAAYCSQLMCWICSLFFSNLSLCLHSSTSPTL